MATKLNLQLSKQQQQMLVLGFFLLGGGGFSYYKFFWYPFSARIDDDNKQIVELDAKIMKAQAEAARLPKIQQELDLLNQQAAEAEKRLPKIKDVPEVIDTLSRMAGQNGVALSAITPGRESPKQYFIEIPYSVNASGTYSDIGRFFAAIALEDRIYNVRDVNFGGPANDQGKISVSFTFVSYQYKG